MPESQIFGYTFACPNVSKNVVKYPNIFNFNNKGDMVTSIPLADWGYKRHGTDIDVYAPEAMFKNLTGSTYTGAGTTYQYEQAFLQIAATPELVEDPSRQMLVMGLAYSMGGKKDVTFEEMLLKYYDENGVAIGWYVLKKVTGIDTVESLFDNTTKIYKNAYTLAVSMQKDTEGMTAEEFDEYKEKNKDAIDDLMGATGVLISEVADFHPVISILLNSIQYADEWGTVAGAFYAQFEGTDGHPYQGIMDAHQMPIYMLWTNREFYGYKGRILDTRNIRVPHDVITIAPDCFAYSDITSFSANKLVYISPNSFIGASKLESVVIPNSVTSIGEGAFYGCSGLKEITLPIERSGFNIFSCVNVETITYTAQGSGVMPARTTHSGTSSYYGKTLEYSCRNSVKKIVYSEGVTEIADYANYHDKQESQLSEIVLPPTVKKIGNYAFYGCWKLNIIRLNKGIESIADNAFTNGAAYRLFIAEPDTPAAKFCAGKNYPWSAPVDFALRMQEDGELSITGYTGSGDTVIVPEKIAVFAVTSIEGDAFAGRADIEKAQIPAGVVRIDDSAFDQTALDVLCEKDSFAHEWAVAKGYAVFHCCFTPDFEIQAAVLPGCYETGLSEGRYCKNCDTVLSVPEEVPAAGHWVILESDFYETTPGVAIEIPIALSCGGVCGRSAHWQDLSEQVAMDIENGMVSWAAEDSGARILEMWVGDERAQAVYCMAVAHASNRMILPTALKAVGDEAFAGMAAQEFVLPEGMTDIGARAFAKCPNLTMIIIPDSVENIADNAFENSAGVVIVCDEGSPAAAYARRREIPCIAKPVNGEAYPES